MSHIYYFGDAKASRVELLVVIKASKNIENWGRRDFFTYSCKIF